jgi:hypothetical protein
VRREPLEELLMMNHSSSDGIKCLTITEFNKD